MKTEALTGTALDWAVAKAEELIPSNNIRIANNVVLAWDDMDGWIVYSPSTDWAQGGPIIERERISLRFWTNVKMVHAYTPQPRDDDWKSDPVSILIAAMRAHVSNKLGDEVDIPDNI